MKITVVAQDLIAPDDDTLPPLSPLHHLGGHCQTSIGTSHIETTTTTHTETKVRTTTDIYKDKGKANNNLYRDKSKNYNNSLRDKSKNNRYLYRNKVRTTATHTETKGKNVNNNLYRQREG